MAELAKVFGAGEESGETHTSALKARLDEVDLNNMTPMAAFGVVMELKSMCGDGV